MKGAFTAEEIIAISRETREKTAAILRDKGDVFGARLVELGVSSTINAFLADPCNDDEICTDCLLMAMGRIIGFTLCTFFDRQMSDLDHIDRARLLVGMMKVVIETAAEVSVTSNEVSSDGVQRPN